MPVILALGRQRWEDHKFKDSLAIQQDPVTTKQKTKNVLEYTISLCDLAAETLWTPFYQEILSLKIMLVNGTLTEST
jgi:hypothetical protein